MWRSLKDPDLLAAYHQEFGSDEPPKEVLSFLESLAQDPALEGIYAVTSLQKLRLTTAPDYTQNERHGSISCLRSQKEGNLNISYFPPGARIAVTGRECTVQEAIEYFQLLLIRHFEERPES